MSRCLPYPPPGYSGKRASNEALIESIKLQREREKAKIERKKEKKREKKEKKREKQEKAKQNSSEIGHDEKAQKVDKSWADSEKVYNKRRRADEAEQLERSGLTEEHEQPIFSQNPSHSSDSTQNSNKRRRHASPSNGCHHSHGKILRIRLPLQKCKEPALSVRKECSSSSSGRTDLPVEEPDLSVSKERLSITGSMDLLAQHKYEIAPGASQVHGTDFVLQGLPLRPDKELSCSTSGMTGFFAKDDAQTVSGSTSSENEMWGVESLYKALIDNWVPQALQSEQPDFDDLDWLFGRNHQDIHGEKRFKASSNKSCFGSSTLWPHAQYLTEADIHVLPFTVPF